MSASTVPDIDADGGADRSTFDTSTPSMAVVMSGRACRAISVRSSARAMATIRAGSGKCPRASFYGNPLSDGVLES
jgi:hypothetical protein